MLESRFVLITIFINLGGSYWVTNLIKFDSFLLRGRRDEAVTSMFATSLLAFFHQTNLSAHRSKYEHIGKGNCIFNSECAAGKSKKAVRTDLDRRRF